MGRRFDTNQNARHVLDFLVHYLLHSFIRNESELISRVEYIEGRVDMIHKRKVPQAYTNRKINYLTAYHND